MRGATSIDAALETWNSRVCDKPIETQRSIKKSYHAGENGAGNRISIINLLRNAEIAAPCKCEWRR